MSALAEACGATDAGEPEILRRQATEEAGSVSDAGSSDEDYDIDETASLIDREAAQAVDGPSLEELQSQGGQAVYEQCDGGGTPQPLVPQLVTLAMVPRSQWQSLVHLDAIKVCRRQNPARILRVTHRTNSCSSLCLGLHPQLFTQFIRA